MNNLSYKIRYISEIKKKSDLKNTTFFLITMELKNPKKVLTNILFL